MNYCSRELCARQSSGAIVLLMMVLAVFGVKYYFHAFPAMNNSDIPGHIDADRAALIIGFREGGADDGVYFLPGNITLAGFFEIIGHKKILYEHLRLLSSGDVITVRSENGRRTATVAAMSNVERMALGLPIPVNTASTGDFTMIPGIGLQLAGAIVDERTKKGHFSGIDDLRSIRGLGQKKLKLLSNYLYF
ncbi:MAG: helix-hairpin-helix domain-containing protein [Deltaproteobacteria bacterium]|nr:helix-hairpin-helix domain-containing protein [Deltaproteobacteria bacterium]